jgi:hypothetical protein
VVKNRASLSRLNSDSVYNHTEENNAKEHFIKAISADPKSSSDYKLCLNWINKAFDSERFDPFAITSGHLKSDFRKSQEKHIMNFNNSHSANTKQNSSGNITSIHPQKYLSSLIRFDFLQNDEEEIDLQELIEEEMLEQTSLKPQDIKINSLASSEKSNNFKQNPVFIIEKPIYDIDHSRKSIPNDSGRKGQVQEPDLKKKPSWNKYSVNGGYVRLEVSEKITIQIEDMKDIPPRIKGIITLEEKGLVKTQLYQSIWPFLDKENLKYQEGIIIKESKTQISDAKILFQSTKQNVSASENIRNEIYLYQYNPQLLKKKIIPMIIEPKIIEIDDFKMNLRILINPKYKDYFNSLDMKLVTVKPPTPADLPSAKYKLMKDGVITKLFPNEFDQQNSWNLTIVLSQENKISEILILGHFSITLFPTTLPNISIETQETTGHQTDKFKELAIDSKLVFDFRKKFII